MTVRLNAGVSTPMTYDNNDKPVYDETKTPTQKKYEQIFNDLKHPKPIKVLHTYTYTHDGYARSNLPVMEEKCEKQPVSDR